MVLSGGTGEVLLGAWWQSTKIAAGVSQGIVHADLLLGVESRFDLRGLLARERTVVERE